MNIAFRTDVSNQIGTGHFMRCLTLADVLKQGGAEIRFISRYLPEYFQDMLTTKEHEHIHLSSDPVESSSDDLAHAHWLGTSQQADAQDSINALSDKMWDWLVVDHYALDARWESALRKTARKILVIDDIADRQHDCDVLLDQNFYADMATRYTGKVPAHCRLLIGPRYALLRDEFRLLHAQGKFRNGPVKRVLVFFGGVDADNYTGRTIEAISSLDVERLNVDVVIGAQHPYRKQIETACAEHHFDCHVQTSQMAELMATADLAIGAGGSATWERCCLGLPTFAISTADNQVAQVADAASEGFLYAPELKELNGDLTQAIKRHLEALLENRNLWRAISSKAMNAVDGRGISRVTGVMGCNDIKIEVACQDDSEHLFEWRNHPAIRAVSRNARVIDWEEHQKWFASVLASSDRVLLVGYRDESAMGVVRFDIQDEKAEVSVYIVPGITEAGSGRDLLKAAEDWIVANRPEVCMIRAEVLESNERSQHLFSGSGYQVESTCYSKGLH